MRTPDRPRSRAVTLVAALALVAASCSSPEGAGPAAQRGPEADRTRLDDATAGAGGTPGDPAGARNDTPAPGRARRDPAAAGSGSATLGASSAGGADPVIGVSEDSIELVYYWKGDQTRSSPFLRGTGTESNVDEAEAFRVLVEYINRNSGTGATFMGFPFDLHGRTIEGTVVEAGSGPEDNTAAAEHIAKELRPFAAVAAHGSVSAYACRLLAANGVFNLATYDLDFDLYERTNGYCLPASASFDAQVDVMERYLADRVIRAPYRGATSEQPRRIGVVWSEHPGLVDSMPKVVDRLKRAGVPVAATATVSASLTSAQQQAPNVVARFRSEGVNTVVMPDAGTPMSFTQAAESQGYRPDYAIWPCSGQDVAAMVRLFNPEQWRRATGLTCFDPVFRVDLTLDDDARRTEWYRQYRSVKDDDPPAPTPFVYAGLLPLLIGVTGAGPDLTPETFRAALAEHGTYRYDATSGRTTDRTRMLLTPSSPDRSVIGDFTVLRWSPSTRRRGNALTGSYTYPEEGRRYARDHAFR